MTPTTYDETMRSVNVDREDKLVATYFQNGGVGLSSGMHYLIAAIVFATPNVLKQLLSIDDEDLEISIPRLVRAVEAYRVDD